MNLECERIIKQRLSESQELKSASQELKLPKEASVLKPLSTVISTEKVLKIKLLPENKNLSKLSPGICKPSFYKRIEEKYYFFKRTSLKFPDLIFLKLAFSNSTITNIKIIKNENIYSYPQFYLTFCLIRNENTKIDDGISKNNYLFSCSEEQKKTTISTIYRKLNNWHLTSRQFNVSNESTSFYLSYKHLKEEIPEAPLFQKSFNSPFLKKLYYKQCLLGTDIITSKITTMVSNKNDMQAINESYKSIKGRKNEIEIEKDVKSWKTKELGILGFRHLIPSITRNFYSPEIFIPHIFMEEFLLKKNGHMEIQDFVKTEHLLNSSGIVSKEHRISGWRIQNPEDISFLKTVEASELRPDFLTSKCHIQKSDKRSLIVDNNSKVETIIPDDTFKDSKKINLMYLNPYEGALKHPIYTKDRGKTIFGEGQDIVLRKPIESSSKEISLDIKENEHKYVQKENTRFLLEKSNYYDDSPVVINNIVNKVYRLLETRLLIEKERRGLR